MQLECTLADYNQAIKFAPNQGDVYYNRGRLHSQLGDKQGAIADFQKAADIYQQQSKTTDYQDAINRIAKLQQQ